jgi:glutamate dehydrogenase/leucine dehydrogenase
LLTPLRSIKVEVSIESEGGELLKFMGFRVQHNKAAELGADSIRIFGSNDVSARPALNSRGGTVMVEALKCQ